MRFLVVFLVVLAVLLLPSRGSAQWDWGRPTAVPDDGSCWSWDGKKTQTPLVQTTPKWIDWENGWCRSSVSGHWSHPYWGHKDRDFDWSTWFPSAEDVAECNTWMKDNGHSVELPNQHHIGYMQKTPWQLQQEQYTPYQTTPPMYWQQPMPMYQPMMQRSYSMPMFRGSFRRGASGSCST